MRRGMKQLLGRDQTGGQPFRMMVAEKFFQDMPVGGKSIRPEIASHELLRCAQLLLDKRQRDLRCRGVFKRRKTLGLGLLHRLENRSWKPWMLLDKLAADAGQMHDRKNSGLLEIIVAGRHRVSKHPADIRIAFRREAGGAWSNEAVDLAARQKL